MRIKFLTASLIALASLAQSSFASPVNVFFSTTAFPTASTLSPTVPTLTLTGSQQATLYIWAAFPNTLDVVNALGLDVTSSTPGVVTAFASSVLNTPWTVGTGKTAVTHTRWDATSGGTLNASSTVLDRNINGFSVQVDGLNANTDIYADQNGAGTTLYFGSLTLQGVATGTTHLKFAISSLASSYTSASPDVGTQNFVFGTDTAPVSGANIGGTGTGYDATINVTSVPEPAAFGIGLLTLGAMFIGYRRQHAQA